MKNNKKIIFIITSIVLTLTIGSTIAYIYKINNKNNPFETGVVSSSVIETFNGTVKSNVYIHNNGNVKEYIRVFINVYYKDSEGTILADIPIKDTDYSLTLSSSTNWLYNSSDNFYYYKLPVEENMNTDILINECRELISHTGKILNVDIYSQSIQTEPVNAVTSSWNVTVLNENIVLGG